GFSEVSEVSVSICCAVELAVWRLEGFFTRELATAMLSTSACCWPSIAASLSFEFSDHRASSRFADTRHGSTSRGKLHITVTPKQNRPAHSHNSTLKQCSGHQ